MKRSERWLIIVLRFTAVVLLFAIPAVIMPHSWMDALHRWLGLGELPDMPIVGYLARTLSAFYAIYGAVLLYLSFDVRRYLPLVRFLAVVMVLAGAGLIPLDCCVGMPWFWTVSEGPFVTALGVVLFLLARQAGVPSEM